MIWIYQHLSSCNKAVKIVVSCLLIILYYILHALKNSLEDIGILWNIVVGGSLNRFILFCSFPLKTLNTTHTLFVFLWKILEECIASNRIVTSNPSTTTIFRKEWNTNPWNAQHGFYNWNRFSSREWTNAHKTTCLMSTILFTRGYRELVLYLARLALVVNITIFEGGKAIFWPFCAKLWRLLKSKTKKYLTKIDHIQQHQTPGQEKKKIKKAKNQLAKIL